MVRFTGNTHVAKGAFRENESLMELLDVSSLTEIAPYAFARCTSLVQIVGHMPKLKSIGDGAFYNTQLTQFLGDFEDLEIIRHSAFEGTPLVQLGYMPKLIIISERAFAGTQLTQLGITQLGNMQSLTTICEFAFAGTPLAQLGDMEKLKFIGGYAFAETRLAQLGKMPELTFIGEHAFAGTPLAQLGDMPKLTTIDERAFANCRSLSVVRLPNTLKEVGRDAFINGQIGELTVEPGADFVCKCVHLAKRLRELSKKNKNIHIQTIKRGKFGIYQIISR